MSAASAKTLRLRRPATDAVEPATSAASAPRRVAPAWVVLVAARSVTSADSGVTLPVTAPRVAAMAVVPVPVATVVAVEAMAAVLVDTAVLARPPATPAEVSAT